MGGTANQATCQTRPQARPTRIDGVLASREAVAWIGSFGVEGNDNVPTHKILKLTLQGEAAEEERTYAKKLRSLKEMFLNKVADMTKDQGEKEQRDTNKTEVEKLKQSIARECLSEKTRLEVLAKAKDTNA